MEITGIIGDLSDVKRVTVATNKDITHGIYAQAIRLSKGRPLLVGAVFGMGNSENAFVIHMSANQSLTEEFANAVKELLNEAETAANSDEQKAIAAEAAKQHTKADYIAAAAKAFGVPIQ